MVAKTPLPQSPRPWIPALILAALGFLLYAGTLQHDYVMDDASVIQENWVTRQGLAATGTIFTTPLRHGYREWGGGSYRPLAQLTFAAEWQARPNSPALGHTVNALLYGGLCAAVFLLLLRLAGPLVAFVATLWFTTHPLHTEVVANIKGREDILCLGFGVLALLAFTACARRAQGKHLALAGLFYLAALLSKETAVTFIVLFPAALLLLRAPVRRALSLSLAVLPSLAVYFALRAHALANSQNPGIAPLDNFLVTALDFSTRLASAFAFVPKYAALLVYPHPLVSDYSYAQYDLTTWSNPQSLLGVALVVLVLAGMVWGLAKRHIAGFSLLFLAATFSLTSNLIVVIGSNFGERFLFAPSLGFALLAAWAFARLAGASTANSLNWTSLASRDRAVLVTGCLVALALSMGTVSRAADWKDEWTLYSTDVMRHPDSARLQYHFGLALSAASVHPDTPAQDRASAREAALSRFYRALSIYPDFPDAHAAIGLTHLRGSDFGKAQEAFREAILQNPASAEAFNNLAVCLLQMNNLDGAVAAARHATEIRPHFTDAWRNLAAIHMARKEYAQAVETYRRTLSLEPWNQRTRRALADAERMRDAP